MKTLTLYTTEGAETSAFVELPARDNGSWTARLVFNDTPVANAVSNLTASSAVVTIPGNTLGAAGSPHQGYLQLRLGSGEWKNYALIKVRVAPAPAAPKTEQPVVSGGSPRGDLAPKSDIPVVSFTDSSTITIPGSVGWYRERRTGAANPAPGTWPGATTGLDQTGSSYFTYPGIPLGETEAVGANPTEFVTGKYKPGSSDTVQAARWLMAISFRTSSDVINIRGRAPTSQPGIGMILVNGQRVSDKTFFATEVGAGDEFVTTLTFPSATVVPRTITVYGIQQFGGVAVKPGFTVEKPVAPVRRRIAIIGDSYVNGSENSISTPPGAAECETYAWKLALAMGADEIVQAGIGGTGWNVTNSLGAVSRFSGRVSAVMSTNPDVVLFVGGRNDSAAGLQAVVESTLDAVSTADATCARYVIHTAHNTNQAGVVAAMAAGAASRNVPFIEVDNVTPPKLADNVHLTFEGHDKVFQDALRKVRLSGSDWLG